MGERVIFFGMGNLSHMKSGLCIEAFLLLILSSMLYKVQTVLSTVRHTKELNEAFMINSWVWMQECSRSQDFVVINLLLR